MMESFNLGGGSPVHPIWRGFLLGLAAYLLIKDVGTCRGDNGQDCDCGYVPVYTAFDALAGIGTGTLVQQVSCLSPDQTAALPTVDAFWNGAPLLRPPCRFDRLFIAMLASAVALTILTGAKWWQDCGSLVFRGRLGANHLLYRAAQRSSWPGG
jgi:hypothetical protein